jgi:RimJ/RimL family protein N-acetyltransferase
MKTGKVVHMFSASDGRKVVLRALRWEDLDDLLEMINSLVEEKANITLDQKVSRETEIDWLSRALSRQERNEVLYVAAEVEGNVVANSEISRRPNTCERHVGVIGIAIKKGFRDMGIGTMMTKSLVEQGRTMGLRVLTLGVFANNERAIHVYKKVGFVESGRITQKFFKDGQYIDEIVMTMLLE